MNCVKLTTILGQAIIDINNDNLDLQKAQMLIKASNSLIKLKCAEIAYKKLNLEEAKKLSFFE